MQPRQLVRNVRPFTSERNGSNDGFVYHGIPHPFDCLQQHVPLEGFGYGFENNVRLGSFVGIKFLGMGKDHDAFGANHLLFKGSDNLKPGLIRHADVQQDDRVVPAQCQPLLRIL